VLRQGSSIDAFMKAQVGEIKGRSEWDTMARNLGRLAGAYAATFPISPTAAVRRINDKEASSIADRVIKDAEELKKQVDKESGVERMLRDSTKRNLDTLKSQAEAVKSRVSDSRPATSEVRQLLQTVAGIDKFMAAQPSLLPGTKGAWGPLQASLTMLKQAYNIP
jgi:hypothetical protein